MSENTEFTLFKSAVQSCKYIFKDGSTAIFVKGRYATDEADRIAELKAEVKAKHPTIYIDPKEAVTSAKHQDPIAALRAKIIADYIAEQAAKEGKDFGNTDSSGGAGAGMLTTSGAKEAAKESSSGGEMSATAKATVTASLAHLKSK